MLLKERLCLLAEDSWKSPGAQPILQVEAHRQKGESDPGMVITRAACLHQGGDSISLLKTVSEQPNCSCSRRRTWGPGAALALSILPGSCAAGIVYLGGKAVEEGHCGQPARR